MDSVDRKNREKVYDLVSKHFSLDPVSIERFKKRLFEPEIDETYEKILGGSEDLRKRWKINLDLRSDIDEGWVRFKQFFRSFHINSGINYSDFRDNLVLINKNHVKLTKAVMDYYTNSKSSVSEDFGPYIEERNLAFEISNRLKEILDLKLPKKDVEVVLSLNFVDWFLCSTGEGWSSCLRLNGNYPYWVGLPGLIIDKNLSMMYVTHNRSKEFHGIKTDKFVSRSWVLLDEKDRINLVRWYPINYLSNIKLKKITKLKLNSFASRSKHPVKFLRYKSGDSAYIYMDASHFTDQDFSKDDGYYHRSGGAGFCFFDKSDTYQERELFNFGEGLDHLIENDSEILDFGRIAAFNCFDCNGEISEEDSYTFGGEIMCESCYNENVAYCSGCETDFWKEDLKMVDDEYVCNNCLAEFYVHCEECDDYIHKDNVCFYENKVICHSCISIKKDVKRCYSCDVYFDESNMEYIETQNNFMCLGCLNEHIDKKQLKLEFEFAQ